MATEAGFYLHIDGFEGFDRFVDFDRKPIRKAMRSAGQLVRRDAVAYVSRGAVSKPGEYPGKQRGVLSRSIKVKVSRSGFLVRVSPQMVDGMKAFYPAFLAYGARHKAGARRDRRSKGVGPLRIEPRANYMVDAKDARATEIRMILSAAFASSLRIK